MRVTVRLFARARDLAGSPVVELELAEPATVADLRRGLAAACPALTPLLGQSAVAVDDDFADGARPLFPSSEVALLPPVSGG
jgi:molybdopterin converting factor small subunit